MAHHAAIEVWLAWRSVGVVDAEGEIGRKAKIPSERTALVAFFDQSGLRLARLGLGAGPLSPWRHAGLVAAGRPALLIETRQVKAALKAMTTARHEARGRAPRMRLGWFRTVPVTTLRAQEIRALLSAQAAAGRAAEPPLRARAARGADYATWHRHRRAPMRRDEARRRLITVPGVGAVVAMTVRAGIDQPQRFT